VVIAHQWTRTLLLEEEEEEEALEPYMT